MENEELNQALKGLWDSLTDEQKERAQTCASMEELLQFASEEKIELPLDSLEEVAGGYVYWSDDKACYEIINDETGEVMDENAGRRLDVAQARARELGQDDGYITWDELEKLRRSC